LADEIDEALEGLALDVRPFDRAQARAAGLLRRATRDRGLSLGDRACLALGLALQAPVVTTDSAWEGLEAGVEVQRVR
jgi:PIN domain nuclease of toxin-antitoxin system